MNLVLRGGPSNKAVVVKIVTNKEKHNNLTKEVSLNVKELYSTLELQIP
jgi:hypothetical protein